MPDSKPLIRLEKRLADARRLVEIHEEATGPDPGRRHNYDVLNRSAVVLAVAAWESFIEDLAAANARFLARRLFNANAMPDHVRDGMLFWMHAEHKLHTLNRTSKDALWRLTDDKWRTEYVRFAVSKLKRFNTPNHDNVRRLFSEIFGIEDVARSWGYRRWPHEIYVRKLNELLRLRHEIAHGTIGDEAVRKTRARDGINLVSALSSRTDGALVTHRRSLRLRRFGIRIDRIPSLGA